MQAQAINVIEDPFHPGIVSSSEIPRAGTDALLIEFLKMMAKQRPLGPKNEGFDLNGPTDRIDSSESVSSSQRPGEERTFDLKLEEIVELSEINDQVSEWRQQISIQLVVGTLFLSVVTGFAAPITQAWLASPYIGKEHPAPSDTVILPLPLVYSVSLYALSIVFGTLDAVMCVMGLIWAGQLLVEPKRNTREERRTTRTKRRQQMEKLMSFVICVSYCMLLYCILLFVVGGITEIMAVGLHNAPKPLVGVCGAIGMLLALLGTVAVFYTTAHAIAHDDSPFETPWTELNRKLLDKGNGRWKKVRSRVAVWGAVIAAPGRVRNRWPRFRRPASEYNNVSGSGDVSAEPSIHADESSQTVGQESGSV
ncbi:hypothetical protein SISSUDRAFT_1066134 [Sistotremastrum suecicum HHB10207 ss-3]|uniref:DUF6535 domain-containing protein n=1 Tax=Sistotremastrum suecicum HHB10207 ss-3 TaxID=1314776 RepID=A0A165YP74_9AGAM|nr:hypothetical protein SISSUDRAFT_1066134 [Sistotremastrum suecicum HHB10207 ss-3]